MLEPPWGFEAPDLRITSLKRGVHRVLARRGLIGARAPASTIVRCVGCSLGCSTPRPAERQKGQVSRVGRQLLSLESWSQ